MQARYALRFDSGERKGDLVPVTGAGVTIGRKPGNSVQLLDASVSGKHAEFVVEPAGIVLRDLGSTNGTRVGGERVSQHRLNHGDEVMLGNVRLTFLDTEQPAPASSSGVGGSGEVQLEFGEPARAAAPGAATAAASESGDSVRTISAEKIAKSQKLSKVGVFGMLFAVAIGAGGWWWIQSQEQGASPNTVRAVEETPGNLLGASFSFEGALVDGEDSAWNNEPSAPAAFEVDGASRRSGEDGLGAVLSAEQHALVRSKPMAIAAGRQLQLSAWLRLDGGASGRIGLEFEHSSGAAAPTLAWSPAMTRADDFENLEWSCAAPPGFDSVRVALSARAGSGGGEGSSSADFDDVVLLSAGSPETPLAHDSFQWVSLGAPPTAAVLFKIDRALISDFHVRRGEHERLASASSAADNGFSIDVGQGADRTLSLRAGATLTTGGVASLGSGGYRTHTTQFERDGLTRMVLGAGKDLVCLSFDAPVQARARAEGGGQRFEFALGSASRVLLQVVFRAERETALSIAREAREAERAERFGDALATWTRLRDEAPFDSELLAEGEAARGRLAERGLAEVRALRAEVERARFFRLVELFRKCRAQAEAIARRYAGGEIETQARELAAEVRRDLDVLEADLNKNEKARLEGVARALEAAKSEKLATRVRTYLSERFTQGLDERTAIERSGGPGGGDSRVNGGGDG